MSSEHTEDKANRHTYAMGLSTVTLQNEQVSTNQDLSKRVSIGEEQYPRTV